METPTIPEITPKQASADLSPIPSVSEVPSIVTSPDNNVVDDSGSTLKEDIEAVAEADNPAKLEKALNLTKKTIIKPSGEVVDKSMIETKAVDFLNKN